MMKPPFFSIIVPCYNRAQFLTKTILSIQQQTFSDFEIIVIDDGSTDNTRQVIENLLSQDPRIKYFYQPNAERGAARNNGIKNAFGQYIVFLDSDDEMKTDYLMRLQRGISENTGYDFYAAKYNFLNNGREYRSTIAPFKQGPYGINTVLKGNPFACNFCIRNYNPKLILFEEDRTLASIEDWMFLVENLYQDKIYVFDFIGLSMNQHEGRSMQQNKMLIERRIKATKSLAEKKTFSGKQKKTLWAYSYYFCAVHAYLDFNRSQALKYIWKSVRTIGLRKDFAVCSIKALAGKKLINKVKRILK